MSLTFAATQWGPSRGQFVRAVGIVVAPLIVVPFTDCCLLF